MEQTNYTTLLLEQVLPEESILFKVCTGSYDFYRTAEEFNTCEPFLEQGSNESFDAFIQRIAKTLAQPQTKTPQ